MIKKHYIKELNIDSVLKIKSKGTDVRKVQEWLNLWRIYDRDWYHTVTVDEDYGSQTESVVREFQSKQKLEVDGEVDDNTFRKLTEPMIKAFSRIDGTDLRELIVKYAHQHLKSTPQELYHTNQGPWVRVYMDGNEGKQWAWCMGFVQTILDQACSTINQSFQLIMPRTFSCDVVGEYGITNKKLMRKAMVRNNREMIQAGDVFLIAKQEHDWTHTGIITGIEGDWMHTIEGNTNDEGSREGFEVCMRQRNFVKNDIEVFKVI
jgi:hypothetical protein